MLGTRVANGSPRTQPAFVATFRFSISGGRPEVDAVFPLPLGIFIIRAGARVIEDKNWLTRVRERAYEHFLRRQGGSNGDALSDWLNAENETRIQAASHTGQAKADEETRRLGVVDRHGHDLENPA